MPDATFAFKDSLFRLVPLEEETLASKFVWGQVLSENLARLAVNHFATKHYLTQQVLPAIDKDLKTLEEYASQFDDEKAESFNDWMSSYKQVQNGRGTQQFRHRILMILLTFRMYGTLQMTLSAMRTLIPFGRTASWIVSSMHCLPRLVDKSTKTFILRWLSKLYVSFSAMIRSVLCLQACEIQSM